MALAAQHEGWLGLMLLDLATGDSIESITERLEVARPSVQTGDSALLDSLKRPAAQTQFAFIDDQDELRRVIESGDLKAWRTFLHPEQRRYVDATFSGPFRLSGGAGTGKTVVLIHRARALARRAPTARIVLTTFTTNLADALREGVTELDPSLAPAAHLGGPACSRPVWIRWPRPWFGRPAPRWGRRSRRCSAGPEQPSTRGLRRRGGETWSRPPRRRCPPSIATDTFLSAEYGLVVLPHRIRTAEEYLRVRRPGRGVALDRARRHQVWDLIQAYRVQSRLDGTLDYAEAAAVAAAHLETQGPLVDHVLVDEGQDLSPVHWQMLRALVAPGTDDLFLAEDSHQRIYGAPVVLGRYGIRIVGRSRRLTLNYRTTAQNLHYALGILEGGSYVDLEENAETTGYRSARTGPAPRVDTVESLTAELDTVSEIVRGWIEGGTPPDSIAVLVRRPLPAAAPGRRADPGRTAGAGDRPGSTRSGTGVGADHAPGQGHGVLQGGAGRSRVVVQRCGAAAPGRAGPGGTARRRPAGPVPGVRGGHPSP